MTPGMRRTQSSLIGAGTLDEHDAVHAAGSGNRSVDERNVTRRALSPGLRPRTGLCRIGLRSRAGRVPPLESGEKDACALGVLGRSRRHALPTAFREAFLKPHSAVRGRDCLPPEDGTAPAHEDGTAERALNIRPRTGMCQRRKCCSCLRSRADQTGIQTSPTEVGSNFQ